VLACQTEVRATDDNEKPEIVGPVPAFKVQTLEKRLAKDVSFKAQYPQFGIALIDNDIERHVKAALNEFLSTGTDADDKYEYTLGYSIYATTPGIISVVLSMAVIEPVWSGWSLDAMTYDLSSQKLLRLADIFPDWEKSRSKLLALARVPYKADVCDSSYIKFDDKRKKFDNFYITPKKLVMSFNGGPTPIHVGAGESECAFFSITKANLKKAGADMRYWETTPIPAPK